MIPRVLSVVTDFASSRWSKFVVIVLWLVAVGALFGLAPQLNNVYSNNPQQVPASDDSQVAAQILQKEFPSSRGTPAIIVLSDPNGLSTADRAIIQSFSDYLTSSAKPEGVGSVVSIATVPQAASQLVSADGTTTTVIVSLPESPQSTIQNAVTAMRSRIGSLTQGTSLAGYVTGPAGVSVDAITVFSSINIKLTLATLVLVLVLLLIVYRSPILALLPLVSIGVVLQVIDPILAVLAKGGAFPVTQQADAIATVLLFGAGTDYTIFIASRFREELRATQDKHVAMRTTMRAVGEAITSSAATVILALLTLLLGVLTLYSSLGPTMAITIAVMLVAGLTLVPALLVWLGRAAYWPLVPRYSPEAGTGVAAAEASARRGFWGWLGAWTARHRVAAVVSGTMLLVILALGNIGIARSYNFLSSFRVATDSANGFKVLEQHFPAGALAPTSVLISLPSGADAYQELAQIDAVTVALAQVPKVAEVQGPTRPNGQAPSIPPAQLQQLIASLPASIKQAIQAGDTSALATPPGQQPDPQRVAAIGAYAASLQYVSPDSGTIQLTVTFSDSPYALPAIDRIPTVRQIAVQALQAQGLGSAQVHIGGQTSLLADTQAGDSHDTRVIVPVVLLLVGIVLALLLRSLIAPLYLLAAVTLNFFAAIGVSSFFFQRVQGEDGIYYAIPLYTFIFLVALGADYTIFLMTRIREEAARHGLEAGVPLAVGRTGGVITSAGLILAGTFLVLTTVPLTLLYQFGVCVAVGVLLDTFVVRGLLVPGLVLILGRWNWWPGQRPEDMNPPGKQSVASPQATLSTGEQ